MSDPSNPLILLTGATGYIGGRLLHVLEKKGHRLRCLVRRPEFLRTKVASTTEIVSGDLLQPETLTPALSGVHTAYYLVHSMGSTGTFEEQDRLAAGSFTQAAKAAGARRIIYLGGLGSGPGLSSHLESRQEVGRILRESGIPILEFRASIIIGSGSLSFEMIRALVHKLPIMIIPRWVRVKAQPIGIEDVLAYLVEAASLPFAESRIYEIGGPEAISYLDIMKEYARQMKLKRIFIPVPVLTPWLSSLWLGLVTPVYARVGRKLIDSIRNETVVTDPRALRDFPIRPRGIREAIERALINEDLEFVETRWADALSSQGPVRSWGGVQFGTRLVDSRTVRCPCPPAQAFEPIQRIGGENGWYYGDWLWHLRGFMDLLAGGAGLRRGRRDPERLLPGDTVDFWRVEAIEPPRLLRLSAEMKLPGRAWLQFEVEAEGSGSIIRQTAIFDPVGLLGLAYWYSLYPVHQFVFTGMLKGIARASKKEP